MEFAGRALRSVARSRQTGTVSVFAAESHLLRVTVALRRVMVTTDNNSSLPCVLLHQRHRERTRRVQPGALLDGRMKSLLVESLRIYPSHAHRRKLTHEAMVAY